LLPFVFVFGRTAAVVAAALITTTVFISIHIIPITVPRTLGVRQLIIFSGWPGSGKTYLMDLLEAYLMSSSAARTSEYNHVSYHEADTVTQPYMRARRTRQYTLEQWGREVNCMRGEISALIRRVDCQIVLLFGLVWLGKIPVDITDHLNTVYPLLQVTKYWISVTEGTMLLNRRARAKDEHALARDVTVSDVKKTLLQKIPPGFQTITWYDASCTVRTFVDGPVLLPHDLYPVYANQLPRPPLPPR
jgi:hypothetical protein